MSEHISPIVQKKTIWYGIADTAKKLGPEAWEKRVEKVINEQIIPRVSPEAQATIKKYEPQIAKAGGWIITGSEVAVVAAAAYGGIRLIGRIRAPKEGLSMPPIDAPVPVPMADAAPRAQLAVASKKVGTTQNYWRHHPPVEEPINPLLKQLRKEALHANRPIPLEESAKATFGSDVPEWLASIIDAPAHTPSMTKSALKHMRRQEKADRHANVVALRMQREAFRQKLHRHTQATPFLIEHYKQRVKEVADRAHGILPAAPIHAPRETRIYGERMQQILGQAGSSIETKNIPKIPPFIEKARLKRALAERSEAAAIPVSVDPKERARWWLRRKKEGLDTTAGRELRANAKAHARSEARMAAVASVLPAQQEPAPSQREIWDFQQMRMDAKREMDADLDQRKRLAESLERAAIVREQRAAQEKEASDMFADLTDKIDHNLKHYRRAVALGSTIDPVLAQEHPDLVAEIAGRVAKLGTNEEDSALLLATCLARVAEDPQNKAFAPLVQQLQQPGRDPRSVDVLNDAARLLEQAYNSRKGIKKILGGYGSVDTKFTTLAAFWAQRLGLAGLKELVGHLV